MIKNEKQYQNARKRLVDLNEAHFNYLKQYKSGNENAFLGLKNIEALIENQQTEITEYEDLKSGRRTTVILKSLGELPEVLIKARIAKRWTHAELAEKVGLKEQQIQRYESTEYAGASTWKLLHILDALGISTPPIQIYLGNNKFDTGEPQELIEEAQRELGRQKTLLVKNAS